jgi:protein O-mannosyl-transferase
MAALWAYAGYARRPFSTARYLAVAGLFALGLMAKPMLVTLPFLLLLLDYWPLGRLGLPETNEPRSFPRRVVVEKLPLLALTAASSVITFLAQGDAVAHTDLLPVSQRIANATVSYAAYLGSLVYPAGLAVLYPHPMSSLPVWKVAAALLPLTGISIAALVWRRRFPYLFVGWFWYVGMMVPVIGLVQVGSHSLADRYTYLPQIGLVIAATWGAARLARSWGHRDRVFGIASALVVLALMGLAWQQVSYWRDSATLWKHTLAHTELNPVAHYNLGNALVETGHADAAITQYQRALSIKTAYVEARYNLGNALAARGRTDEAIAHYRKVLELKPDHAKALNNLGIALAGRGQAPAAIDHYGRALEIQPGSADAHYNLGNALAASGQPDAAIDHYRKALEIRPDDAKAHNNLGNALAANGRATEAIAHYRRALELQPRFAEAHNNLATTLEESGQMEAAIDHYRKALEIRPGYADAHYNLGIALANRREFDAAVAHLTKVLEITPGNRAARDNLDVILRERGRRQ